MPTPEWVPAFLNLVRDAGAQDLGAGHLTTVSDYSSKGDFRTYSFLVFDQASFAEWVSRRDILRRQMPDNRRFSYKKLGPTSQLNAFVDEFLTIADDLRGWLFTVTVNKRLDNLVADDQTMSAWARITELKGNWKSRMQFESVLRINVFFALVLSQVIGETRTLDWISDQDDVFANDDKSMDVASLLRHSLLDFTSDIERYIQVGTSEIDNGDLYNEDLLSIPDLAAGAVSDAATHRFDVDRVAAKSTRILSWLANRDGTLSKLVIEFRPEDGQMMSLHAINDELGAMAR